MLPELGNGARDAAREVRFRLLATAATGLLGLAAGGFATAALFLHLSAAFGALNACLAMTGLLLALALLVWLALRARTAPPPSEPRAPEQDAVEHLLATFLAGLRAARSMPRR